MTGTVTTTMRRRQIPTPKDRSRVGRTFQREKAQHGSRAEGACVKALGALLREGDAVAKAAEAKALEEGSKDPSKRRLQTLQATLDQACARFVRGKIDAQIWAEVGGGSLPATCTVSSYRAQGEAKASQALDAKEEARRKAS